MFKCFYKNCLQQPIAACECDNRIFMCSTHVSVHSLQPGSHSEKPISPELVQSHSAISRIYQARTDIEAISANINLSTSSIIQYVQSISEITLQTLDKLDQICANIICTYLENPASLDQIHNPFELTPLENTFSADRLNNLLLQLGEFYKNDLGCDCSIHWIEENSIKSFDILNKTTVNFPQIGQGLGTCSSVVEIGLNKELCYGGIKDNKTVGAVWLVNKNTGNLRFLKPGRPRVYAASVYYKENIYFFGGWCGNILADCQVFSLKNEWTEGYALPEASNYCNATVYNGVWVTGYNMRRIYFYHNDSLKYSAYMELESETCKYCIGVRNQLHVIYRDKVFVLANDQWKEEKLKGRLTGYICSPFKIKGNFAYFVEMTDKTTLKKYNLQTYSIEELT